MNTAAPAPARIAALTGAAALTLGGLSIAPAYAHDSLIDSTPAEGEVLEESPEEIVLEFSGAGLIVGDTVTNDIWVIGEDDQNWATEQPADVEGSTMSTDLDGELPNGEYEVIYRVVYSDGHDEELSFAFEVDAEEDAAQQEEPEDDEPAQGQLQEAPDEDDEQAQEEDGELLDQEDAAQEEDEGVSWTPVLIGLGVVAVLGALALLVRRQLKDGDKAAE